MTKEKRSGTDELVDTELQCVTCGTRLYISTLEAPAVIASLQRCGAAILICICGQAQLIRHRRMRHD